MTQMIQIKSARDGGQVFNAEFEPVRSGKHLTLGWAIVDTGDGATLRFPAILNRHGTVYTVSDWQAPPVSFGDLSEPYDWASLCATGVGQFVNPRLHDPRAISTRDLDL